MARAAQATRKRWNPGDFTGWRPGDRDTPLKGCLDRRHQACGGADAALDLVDWLNLAFAWESCRRRLIATPCAECRGDAPFCRRGRHSRRSTIIVLMWAIALAGLSPLGQVLAQFMIVWQR